MVLITAAAGNALRMDLFNFDRLTDYDSVIVTQSSSALVIDVDGYRYAFSGSGVRYNGFGEPTAGTITGFTFSQGGQTLFQVGGVSVAASPFYVATYAPNNPMPLFIGGNDEYRGGAFDDAIIDYNGHNVMLGGGGADTLTSGAGNDHIYGQSPGGGSDGADVISAGAGADYINGNAGNDTISGGEGSDRIQGGADDDVLSGDGGNDTINGNRGNDRIDGGIGADSLRGGQGDDTIAGGAGNDILSGDLGADRLTGGDGADVFLFAAGTSTIATSIDTVTDFQQGTDLIALGFAPASVLVGTTATSIETARSAAQALFDGHAGDQEVAAIGYQGGTLLFWSGTGGATVDSVVAVLNQTPADFGLVDFV